MPFGMGLRCEVQDSLAINNRNIGAQVPSPTPKSSPAKQSRRASGRGQPLSSVLSEEASRSPSSASAAASTGRRSAISSKLHSRLDKWKSRMRSISRTLTLRRGQSGLTHVSGAEAELYGGQNEYADRLKLERFERSLAAENMYRTDQAPTYGSSLNDIHIESGDLSEGGTIFDKIKYGSSPSDADVRSQIDELANSETPLSHSDSSRLLSLKDQLGTIESVKNAF
ncbi:uncharacterized protein I303_102103 [Kwoniella dejecticola CBS 10117]|uniref:Uncharacterized protein n=1 Tax=Kwoniella dejecticola CBS 10117 TaxID=1296121 RepID=A0A1A6ABY0_9TREE|nr:uncharacterized protein I303_01756 [Kwoniella dejecticola CBS 10117]OBR87548.1 hypothetical protein I303_01756 [Kwoniella dejecticola CBS 10117]